MPLFRCTKCGCVENSAPAWWWLKEKLCSECKTGKWHGMFLKESAIGMLEGKDGFLYTKKEIAEGGYFHGREIDHEVIE